MDAPERAGDDDRAGRPSLPAASDVADLRSRLDDIRRLLDDAHVPPAPDAAPATARGGRRTRRAAAIAAAGLAAVVAVVAAGAALVGAPSEDAAPGRDAAAGPAAAPTPDGRWPGTDRDAPAALVPTGPGADAPGADVVVAPAADGRTLEVYERVVPAAPDARWLQLTRPVADRLVGVTLPTDLTVSDLRVTAGGGSADVRSVPGGWVVFAADGRALGPVVLRYRVTGAVTTTSQAPQGRRLLLVWPLTAEAARGDGSDVVVHPDPAQVEVRQMLCPLATPQEQLCGSADGQGWTGRIPAGTGGPFMVVQVDPAGI